MKLIAQSLVPAQVPYIHIGYLAGVNTELSKNQVTSLYAIVVAGALLVISLRRVRLLWKLIAVAACCAAVAVVLFAVPWQRSYKDPAHMTRYRSLTLAVAMYQHEGPFPTDLGELQRVTGLDRKSLTDGWKRDLRVVAKTIQGKESHSVVSAGADGAFGTADDMTVFSEGQPLH